MKSAKEMFEELGYACDESCDGFLYSKWVEEMANNGGMVIPTDFNIQINIEKEPFLVMKTKTKGIFNASKPIEITLEELQAINQQVKELGWE